MFKPMGYNSPEFFNAKTALNLTEINMWTNIVEDNEDEIREIYEKISYAITSHKLEVSIKLPSTDVYKFLDYQGFILEVVRDRVVLSWSGGESDVSHK